jgi:hypothetical protein
VLQTHWNWNYFGFGDKVVNLDLFIQNRVPTVWQVYRRMRIKDIRHPILYPITMLMPWSCMVRDLYALRNSIGEFGEIRTVIDLCRSVLQLCGAQPHTTEHVVQWLNQLADSLEEKIVARPALPPAVLNVIQLCALESLPDANYWVKAMF